VAAQAADGSRQVAGNDNRTPVGMLQARVLRISLELGEGDWHPEQDPGRVIRIYAFGESGRPLQDPGPLIRVPRGTLVQATVHSSLPEPVTVHGLADAGEFTVQPGATVEAKFKAENVGFRYYWAAKPGRALGGRTAIESQLTGVLAVDPSEASRTGGDDRIFVIGIAPDDPADPATGIYTINGKSWPYTERFDFKVGQPVHWRWVNASGSAHAMHLHGFYYRVNATGDGTREQLYDEGERPLVVTQHVDVGGTFDMSWTPERAGRWLFHCHMIGHMSPAVATGPASAHAYEPSRSEAAGMAGLVLGINVTAVGSPPVPTWKAERKLQLVIADRKEGAPHYALSLRDPSQAVAAAQPLPETQSVARLRGARATLIGPMIVLTRGQATEVEVLNQTQSPTAIHWHGIELESYYDGVAGWTGDAQQTTPAIQPGGSFVARMTPPRAGTFIYHTHWHDAGQLTNGLYGALIVVPPNQKFDEATDKVFVLSLGTFDPLGELLLVNGLPQPAPLRLKTGVKYRLRLINIAPNNVAMRASLRQAGVPVEWRAIAKDGADLPPSLAKMTTADTGITVGETYDFEYEASEPKELSLEVYLPGPKIRATQGLIFTRAAN
jgi:FtsP/CotA-like multicopper oxidase with cupredoxin domain